MSGGRVGLAQAHLQEIKIIGTILETNDIMTNVLPTMSRKKNERKDSHDEREDGEEEERVGTLNHS